MKAMFWESVDNQKPRENTMCLVAFEGRKRPPIAASIREGKWVKFTWNGYVDLEITPTWWRYYTAPWHSEDET